MAIQHIVEPTVGSKSTIGKAGFWQRQFATEVTRPQIIFDVILGAIGPILCYVFDPLVLRGGLMGPSLFPEYQAFAYLFSGIQISLLCLWLITGPGLQFWNGIIGGVFLAGSLFCFAVGWALLPLFGFTPFLSSLVYVRNSVRALRAKSHDDSNFTLAASRAFGFLLVFGFPTLLSMQVNHAISRAVDEIVHGDTQQAAFATHRLAPLRFFADAKLDRLANAYAAESDDRRREILKSCYREITGEQIETRLRILAD